MVLIAVFEVALGVIVVGAITIGISFLSGYLVDAGDKAAGRAVTHDPSNTDGTASILAPWLRQAGHKIQENWQYLIENFPKDYQELEP